MSHDVGMRCVCVAEHRPFPLELHFHHVVPLTWGGPDVESNRVALCPSTHVNVHEILRTLMQVGPMSYWLALQEWPGLNRYAFRLALDGYDRWRTMQQQAPL